MIMQVVRKQPRESTGLRARWCVAPLPQLMCAHNAPMSLYEWVDGLDGRQLQQSDTRRAAQISALTFWASLPTHGPLGKWWQRQRLWSHAPSTNPLLPAHIQPLAVNHSSGLYDALSLQPWMDLLWHRMKDPATRTYPPIRSTYHSAYTNTASSISRLWLPDGPTHRLKKIKKDVQTVKWTQRHVKI